MASYSGKILGGRYKLVRQIATGGMGEVWTARDSQSGRLIAAKILKPELAGQDTFLQRLRMEARNAMQIEHPNLAAVLDHGEEDGVGWIIMEYVEGRPFNEYLRDGNRIAPDQLIPVLIQTAYALQAAHAKEVVHRDIKPSNLLITPKGLVKLTDFGISVTPNQATMTEAGMVMGTAQYLPPEQAMGEPATHAGDLYALGVIAYEALAGRRPFTGKTQVDVAFSHVNDPVPPLPDDVPEELAKVVFHLLRKHPEDRPKDGAELVRELVQAANALGIDTSPKPLSLPDSATAEKPIPTTAQQRTGKRARKGPEGTQATQTQAPQATQAQATGQVPADVTASGASPVSEPGATGTGTTVASGTSGAPVASVASVASGANEVSDVSETLTDTTTGDSPVSGDSPATDGAAVAEPSPTSSSSPAMDEPPVTGISPASPSSPKTDESRVTGASQASDDLAADQSGITEPPAARRPMPPSFPPAGRPIPPDSVVSPQVTAGRQKPLLMPPEKPKARHKEEIPLPPPPTPSEVQEQRARVAEATGAGNADQPAPDANVAGANTADQASPVEGVSSANDTDLSQTSRATNTDQPAPDADAVGAGNADPSVPAAQTPDAPAEPQGSADAEPLADAESQESGFMQDRPTVSTEVPHKVVAIPDEDDFDEPDGYSSGNREPRPLAPLSSDIAPFRHASEDPYSLSLKELVVVGIVIFLIFVLVWWLSTATGSSGSSALNVYEGAYTGTLADSTFMEVSAWPTTSPIA